MGKLAEYLRTEAETIRAAKAKRQSAVTQWTGALEGLFRQVDGWLAEIDPEGLIDRQAERAPGTDPALGEYEAPVFRMTLGDRTVRIVPRARYVAATVRVPGQESPVRAHGLVEIREGAGTGYYLFQLPDGRWYIQSEAENLKTTENVAHPFDRDRFEAAVGDMLR